MTNDEGWDRQHGEAARLSAFEYQVLRNQLAMLNALLQRDNGEVLKQMEATAKLIAG